MATQPAKQPRLHATDFKAVREFIVEMVKRGAIAELIAEIIAVLRRLTLLNAELTARVAATRRKKPPNEAMRRLQLELPFQAPTATGPQDRPTEGDSGTGCEPETDKPETDKPPKRPKKKNTPHGRPKFPDSLPRVEGDVQRVAEEGRTCGHCHKEADTVTYRVTEKLDVEPAKFVIRQEKREVLACGCGRHIVTAPVGKEVVDRGVLGNDLLVECMVDHYADAVPWERMQRNARAKGVPLSANTVASSVFALIELFDGVVDHIGDRCFRSANLALDATGMPVQDPTLPVQLRKATLWAFCGDHRYCYFAYAPSGHAEWLKQILDGYELGSVMADGSATINVVEHLGAKRGGCNSHGRRGLVEAVRSGDHRAWEGLQLYASIFHVEAESKRVGECLEARFTRRQQQTAPLLEKLRSWVVQMRGEVEPQSGFGKALGYLDRQWGRLTQFMRDPLMELTNNEVERLIRGWVLDRKTWMFCGHDRSARCAAKALTLITTCQKMNIEPRAYIHWALRKILDGQTDVAVIGPEAYLEQMQD